MFATILNWLSGGIISQLADRYFKHLENKANSANERERIKAETELGRINARAKTAQVWSASKYFWIGWLAFVLPLAAWWGKIIIIDKMCGCGTTDPLTGQIMVWADLIFQNVFPSGAAVGGAAVIASAIISRK